MKLKNWIGLLPFCVGVCLSPYTMGNVHTNYSAQTEMSVSDVEVKKKELKEFRKKYKLPVPKANQKEIDAALMQVQLYQLERVNETTVTGASILNKGKITLQQGRDIAKTVRALAFAAQRDGGEAKKSFNLYLDFLFTGNIIESIPKYKYSNYDDVRKVPADLLSALSVCDDIRRGRLIAAVWNLLEAEWLYLNAEELKLKVNSDYIYNVVPHLFICAVHNPNDEQAIKDLPFLISCRDVPSTVLADMIY